MNELWEKYGCTECDEYPVLVLTANFGDNKSSFQSEFIDKYGVETPCVPKEDGGSEFNTLLDNQGMGGPTYLIYPDKSLLGSANQFIFAEEKDITEAGITEHSCNTKIATSLHKKEYSPSVQISNISKNSFAVKVLENGVYSLSLYSAKGQLKTRISKMALSVGTHTLNWEKGTPANGVYFVEIDNRAIVSRQKVVIE